MRGNRWLLPVLLLAPAFAARASDKALLIELEQRSGALPGGVSASGAVVAGGLSSGGGFYWMPTTGVIYIGGLGATSVSRDGSTIVGTALDSRGIQAAIWLRAAEWRLLGSFGPGAASCGASLSSATDTSSDGRVVVGLGVEWVQHRACLPVGRVDRHGGPREFRRRTGQSRGRRVGRRQGRGRPPGGRDRLHPGRAVGGRPAGIVHGTRWRSGHGESREHRRLDRRRPGLQSGRGSTKRSDLSKRLGVDEAGRLAMPARASSCVSRPAR